MILRGRLLGDDGGDDDDKLVCIPREDRDRNKKVEIGAEVEVQVHSPLSFLFFSYLHKRTSRRLCLVWRAESKQKCHG